MPEAAVTVIGGGVVGLALAAELSRTHAPLYLLERNPKCGEETSSRNSEVIHAGIYYPRDSLKTRLCIEGNHLLYSLCEAHAIPCRRTGKIITATCESELRDLEELFAHGSENGATLRMLTAKQVHALEPDVVSVGGIFSPSTGIISAHGLMEYFHRTARANGAEIQMRCTVTGLEKVPGGFRVTVRENGRASSFSSERVINAAGLEADTVAGLAGIEVGAAGYRLHWCKGSYFSLPGRMGRRLARLVYPAPSKDTLGVHAVLDLGGRIKFGPDVEYLPERVLDYSVPEAKRDAFAASVRRILPDIRDEDLTPDMSGIRPKLQAQGGPPCDFVISDESGRGLEGLINLIGIDSPGLTASPAIARHVADLMK